MDSVKDASFWKVVRAREEEQRRTDLERIRRGEMPDEPLQNRTRTLSAERRREIEQLIRDGRSSFAITQEAGCSHETVVRIRKEMGLVASPHPAVTLWMTHQPEVKRLAKDGLSGKEIARKLGVSETVVRRALSKPVPEAA